jgi:hypothetical protein
MFGQIYNHKTIRKYVIYFGTLFNNIYVTRDDKDGNRVQTMKVPLSYGPKEKFLARLEGNPGLDRAIAIQLPRLAFEITDFKYAPDRKLTTIGRVAVANPTNPNNKIYQYNPVPYDLEFTLYLMVKNAEDGTQVIEQILPFFTPEWTATLKLNPDLDIKYDVPIILNNISQQDTYEGDFLTRRAIIWTLKFTMKGYIFGPTRSGPVIKQAEIHIDIPEGSIDATPTSPTVMDITVTPGMLANGSPTSNSILTIDKDYISSSNNYGFIIDFQENL